MDVHLLYNRRQKESGRRPFLLAGLALVFTPFRALADGDLDPGGLTFKDFAARDRGSSFDKVDPMIGAGAQPTQSQVLEINNNGGFARIRFNSIKVEVAMPLGWQANEDWERGVGFSEDKRYRLILWRVDFAYEGVTGAEQYAAAKAGAIQSHRPGVKAQARKLSDGTFLLVYENVPDKDGQRTVFDLVVSQPGQPKQGALMTLGVPASDADRGLKLMALLKRSLRVDW
ncbi:MAG: hypothetical protein JSS04_19615 [Proteobacteria bacterium]|nr:hypothetical protein [Pseudomonadota bacterium]